MSSKLNSPFSAGFEFPEKTFTERELVHYMEVEEISKDYNPERPSEFLIEKHVEEYERIPIDEYVQSFASKVGLKNELKGIISQQQMDDFISTHKAAPGFVDLTKLPDTEFEMGSVAASADKAWDSIPDELKAGLSKEEFLKTLTADKIRNYILSQIPKSEEKDGE